LYMTSSDIFDKSGISETVLAKTMLVLTRITKSIAAAAVGIVVKRNFSLRDSIFIRFSSLSEVL